MTKKIKITQKQADAIENYLKDYSKDNLLNDHISQGGVWYFEGNYAMNDISFIKMARALYQGYEIESKFKVGDWVTYNNGVRFGNNTSQIVSINEDSTYASFCEFTGMRIDSLRHATSPEIQHEKEIPLWQSAGREYRQIRIGDKYMCSAGMNHTVRNEHGIEHVRELLDTKELAEFYPLENSISFRSL